MEYNSKAKRISEDITRDIWQKDYDVGKRLPAELTLAAKYGVTRMTLRKAIDILVNANILVRKPHGGTIINPDALPQDDVDAPPRSLPIGVFIAENPSYTSMEICRGARDCAKLHGRNILLLHCLDGIKGAINELRKLDTHQLAGLIVVAHNKEIIGLLRELNRKQLPMVNVSGNNSNIGIPCIGGDDCLAGFEATSLMLERFQRPVYYFGEEPRVKGGTREKRFNGYSKAMMAYGYQKLVNDYTFIAPEKDESDSWWSTKNDELLNSFCINVLKNIDTPASILAENDYIAQYIYFQAEKAKLVVGKDIALAGIDDLPLAAKLPCPLTSVKIPYYEIGKEAASLLIQIFGGAPKPLLEKMLPCSIVERESTQLPAK